MISAIAAGNTCILKGSELSRNASSAIGQIINKNFEPAYLTVIESGPDST
jgi:aldehyde dehydrogenase (NAD+)